MEKPSYSRREYIAVRIWLFVGRESNVWRRLYSEHDSVDDNEQQYYGLCPPAEA